MFWTNAKGNCSDMVSAGCGLSQCLGEDYCCDEKCCHKRKVVYLYNNWYLPVFISVTTLISLICICGICNRLCKPVSQSRNGNTETRWENGAVQQHHLSNSDGVSTIFQCYTDPPPYYEVTSEPSKYPLSLGPPPSYTSVIAEAAQQGDAQPQIAV
ncbi:transmembrane protein 92 isoform X2 [Latimeria chalumnae]|uniref:transmembrane protein 92 isoform X2 n=1 Tax=Latimeria chalumnae TaxID=7897 RepID=UPI0003C1743E|nr:PREDICTED: transmembrane protein 92 isoform X2 [Latimeria chalumnae]XP_005992253.1 PREDICTED: transmembrane protein 92 isoform X2 [Latimeria chalumnae]|eukprot:XP_005992252.1 PREDICTED: transmembrane protein 92 isoform X2 [Latimeria chalumnae]